MWELDCEESWVLKNWCLRTVVLEKTLESPLDCKRSNQSILKEINPGCSLEGQMLKLKLPTLWLPRASWLIGKNPDNGRDWGQEEKGTTRGWDGWMASPTRQTWVWVNSGSWWWTGRPGMLRFMGLQRVRHDWETKLNWWGIFPDQGSNLCLLPCFCCSVAQSCLTLCLSRQILYHWATRKAPEVFFF